jgi:hypothetical protein
MFADKIFEPYKKMTNKHLYLTLLAILSCYADVQADKRSESSTPRLVINIAIDQLRNDYLDAFVPLYGENGFKKLMSEGIVYNNASYSFASVDRASAIATISTGATPYYNNIIGQRWLDRKTLRPVWCVDDAKYPGIRTQAASSPTKLLTSTLTDELKVATGGKAVVYAIAPFRDAAILSAGHAADGAVWLDEKSGYWCTSQYYTKSMPLWLNAFNNLDAPASKIASAEWGPANDLVGNFSYFMQQGLQKPFKHKFTGNRRYQEYQASALVNADLTTLALQCIASTGMGVDKVTDMLCLTYYAGNYDHRPVSECQIELQDTYVRLDQEIARLIEQAESRIGKGNVLFVITSTGYSDTESADYEHYRIPTGTFYLSRAVNLLNMYLGAFWGQGKYVEAFFRNQIFLNHQFLETKKISITDATNRAQEFLAMMSGVRNTYTSLQLLTSNNEHLSKIRNGFTSETCGDLIIDIAPGWKLLNEDTQEQELVRASFIPFPIIIYGGSQEAQHVTTPITTECIAPTISKAIRIRAPNACSAKPLF